MLAQENVLEPVSDPDRVYWFLTDNLGTVRDIANNLGQAVAGGHYQYDAFGQILDGDESLTRYLYTAREFDAATGLQYNRARWYDSHSGRFLSEDPIKDGENWYAYAGNNPTNFVDRNGLWAEPSGTRLVVRRPANSGIQVTPGSVYDPEQGGADAGADSLLSPTGWWGFFTGWERRSRGDGTYFWRKFSDPYSVNPRTGNLQAPAGPERAIGQVSGDVQNGIMIGGALSGARGGESAAAANGRQVHQTFKNAVRAKPGWQAEPRLVDPATGKTAIPDALTPSGRPVELKPNTPSGRATGISQLRKYERATGKSGRVIYYDP